MVGFGVGISRVWFVAVRGKRKDVKMSRNCVARSGFGNKSLAKYPYVS